MRLTVWSRCLPLTDWAHPAWPGRTLQQISDTAGLRTVTPWGFFLHFCFRICILYYVFLYFVSISFFDKLFTDMTCYIKSDEIKSGEVGPYFLEWIARSRLNRPE